MPSKPDKPEFESWLCQAENSHWNVSSMQAWTLPVFFLVLSPEITWSPQESPCLDSKSVHTKELEVSSQAPAATPAPVHAQAYQSPVVGSQGRRRQMLRCSLESWDAQTRHLQNAVTNVEKRFGELCQVFATNVQKLPECKTKQTSW